MTKYTLPPMRPELLVCPNSECDATGRIGVHSHKERRYICHGCKTTFADTSGTLLYGLRHPIWLVLVVLSLLAYGCPRAAIVANFELSERTVAGWQLKAGRHAKTVQHQLVCQGQVEVGQVQADELYTKTQAGPVWIATAMTVFSRLWLWGAISWERDAALITPVIEQVRAAAKLSTSCLSYCVGRINIWQYNPTLNRAAYRQPLLNACITPHLLHDNNAPGSRFRRMINLEICAPPR
jgi:transposase-like protein